MTRPVGSQGFTRAVRVERIPTGPQHVTPRRTSLRCGISMRPYDRCGSKCEILAKSRCFLLCLQEQTSADQPISSVSCHDRTHAAQQKTMFTRSPCRRSHQRHRHCQSERLRGLKIERQFKFGSLIVRKIAGICTRAGGVDALRTKLPQASPRRAINRSASWRSMTTNERLARS
jgi:hypothetical protein